MKRLLLSAICTLLLLCLCSSALADWTCHAVFIDGTVCNTNNEDSSGWCLWCGEDEPLHGLSLQMNGLDFLKVSWFGVDNRGANLYWAVAGTGAWRLQEGITDGRYTVRDLQPGTEYEVMLCSSDDAAVETAVFCTVDDATPVPTAAPTPAPTEEPAIPTAAPTPAPTEEPAVPTAEPVSEPADVPAGNICTNADQLLSCMPQLLKWSAGKNTITLEFDRALQKGGMLSVFYTKKDGSNEGYLQKEITADNLSKITLQLTMDWQKDKLIAVCFNFTSGNTLQTAQGDLNENYCRAVYQKNENQGSFDTPYMYFFTGHPVVPHVCVKPGIGVENYSVNLVDGEQRKQVYVGNQHEVYFIDLFQKEEHIGSIPRGDASLADYGWVPGAYPLGFGFDSGVPSATVPPASEDQAVAVPADTPVDGVCVNADQLFSCIPQILNWSAGKNTITLEFDRVLQKGSRLNVYFTKKDGSSDGFVSKELTTDNMSQITLQLTMDWQKDEYFVIDYFFASGLTLDTAYGREQESTSQVLYQRDGQSGALAHRTMFFYVDSQTPLYSVRLLQEQPGKPYTVGYTIHLKDLDGTMSALVSIDHNHEVDFVSLFSNGEWTSNIFSDDPAIHDYGWVPGAYPLGFGFDSGVPSATVPPQFQ